VESQEQTMDIRTETLLKPNEDFIKQNTRPDSPDLPSESIIIKKQENAIETECKICGNHSEVKIENQEILNSK